MVPAYGAGGQVLPAAVADDEGDVGRLAGLDAFIASPIAACRIAPVEMPAKMPSSSTSWRVRRSASRGPTEKRDDRTEPSYSSGTKPSSMLRRP
jgi:hypothetical protein